MGRKLRLFRRNSMNDCQNYRISNLRKCSFCQNEMSIKNFYTKGKGRIDSNCKECSKQLKVKRYKKISNRRPRLEKEKMGQLIFLPTIEYFLKRVLEEL